MRLNHHLVMRLMATFCLSLGVGCGDQAVTIVVSPIRKDTSGQITVDADKASMTSDRTGAAVTTGKTKVTLVEIREGTVQVDVTHPDFETQRTEVEIGGDKDIILGDATEGIRVRASR